MILQEDSGVASGSSSHSNGLEDTVHTVTVEPERDVVVGQHEVLDNNPSNNPTSSEVPCRAGGTQLPDKSHKRYSESRAHKVLSKDQHRQRRKTCHEASDDLSNSKPIGGSCSDLVDRGSQEQKSTFSRCQLFILLLRILHDYYTLILSIKEHIYLIVVIKRMLLC